MNYRAILIAGCLTASLSFESQAMQKQIDSAPSVGYFPRSFPKDPLDINQFTEHLAIGQILETLVSADREGKIAPGLADSWDVSHGGMTIRFHLRPDAKFSNGSPVTAKDAEYSLGRHVNSTKSQSHEFLKNVRSVKADGAHDLIVNLAEPQVAIFRILSREQLGIVPEGWTFDAASDTPYVTSGAYTLNRLNGQWHFVANPFHRHADQIAVKLWRVVFAETPTRDVPNVEMPDYVPFAFKASADLLFADPRFRRAAFDIRDQQHFMQTTAWWYPNGRYVADSDRQKRAMAAIRELASKRRLGVGYDSVTGVIPHGVPGFLPEPVRVDALPEPAALLTDPVKIFGVDRDIRELFGDQDLMREIELRWKLKLEPRTYVLSDPQALVEAKPDVLLLTLGGGFADPEGFLAVLGRIMAVDFGQFLGRHAATYKAATIEQDWQKRAEFFRALNSGLVGDEYVVPVWRSKIYSILAHRFVEVPSQYRYAARLADVKMRDQ